MKPLSDWPRSALVCRFLLLSSTAVLQSTACTAANEGRESSALPESSAGEAQARFAAGPAQAESSPEDAIASRSALAEAIRIPAARVEPPATCPPPDGTRPDPTLVNTDPAVLERFPLSRVYEQLAELSGSSTPALHLYQQLWDSLDQKAAAKFPAAPHCDDASPPSINQFSIDCPRPEVVLKDSEPDAIFAPVALFNRFDLAPADGRHCGEYRIVYAMRGGLGRNFMIFEGMLPNPNPRCGLESCRPVVEFWEQLAALDARNAEGQNALADRLERFYFKGLAGFTPIVHPEHYGALAGSSYRQSGGQIRVNVFHNFQEWQLREFHLVPSCKSGPCAPVLQPVTVKNNPFHELFDVSFADARAADFQAASGFPQSAPALSAMTVNQISMNIADAYNAGQSDPQRPVEEYASQLGPEPTAFTAAIESAIPGSGLSAHDVARRATTQSCAGCHLLSGGQQLGNGLTWPFSRGFVHVDESGFLSAALWCEFLPARKQILDGFAASARRQCGLEGPKLTVVLDPRLPIELPHVEPELMTVAGKAVGPN